MLALIALVACGRGREEEAEGLCGIEGLEGEVISDVNGPGACGIDDPVAVTRVAGVTLSRPARMTCEKAQALDDWVRDGAMPVIGTKGGGLAQLEVAAGYACRTRNSQRGARLSEHAKGQALDISGFTLEDGTTLTVLKDWRGPNSSIMQALHSTACGPYGTVLGPRSDRFHQDHFHFDVASYRSGPYCR
jgi:hypothetical protein